MPLLAPELIEQIAAANDIVEVIGGYFPLKRAGSAWRANCPFHTEKTPSFQVNPQRQIFKCFGCGAGGSVFRFVMDYEHVDFVTAAKKLADRAGIRIVEQEMSAEDLARVTLRRRLLALHAEAADFFHANLMKKPAAAKARDYLKGRGITGEVAKSWKLGYAPDGWDAMAAFANDRGFSREELTTSGLVSMREDDENADFYDRFRDRLMFPICNDTGEVIAFSGRVLESEAKGAKYVNSPETPLFTKGAILFGLHRSKRALYDKKTAIVCEGQLDLITAFEAGVQNVIAPQGTAFTEKQARILKRYVEEVVLCYDADAAGENAAEKSAKQLLAQNVAVRVATMPAGEDPDSMIRGRGAEAFIEQITAAKDFFDFQIDRLASRPEFATPRGRTQAARKMAETISIITDAVLRETIINRVTMRLEVSAQEFARLLKQPTQKSDDDETLDAKPNPKREVDPTIALLLKVSLTDQAAREWLREQHWEPVLVDSEDAGLVKKVVFADVNVDDPGSLASFLSTLDTADESALIDILEGRKPEFAMMIANDCWRELERRQIRRRLDSVQARLRAPDQGLETIVAAQKEILDLQKRLTDIARPFSPPL
ncbi:MAG: DNA primase [Chthoniobacteraceae bacterium]